MLKLGRYPHQKIQSSDLKHHGAAAKSALSYFEVTVGIIQCYLNWLAGEIFDGWRGMIVHFYLLLFRDP